ncbi:MAG: TonB-dependent receptor [Tannerellaceae bacterium]|nr:TonB-dependent receptor [Tannerellaceae bacterium]
MKKIVLLTTLVCFLCHMADGQILKGHVYNAQTHEPLIGVNITSKIKGTDVGTVTDMDGAYEILLTDGGVEVNFSYIGYEAQQIPLVIGRGKTSVKNIYLKMSSMLMDEVIISAGRFEQKLSDITVSMDLLKAADIRRQTPTDLTTSLNTLPGVDINDRQPSIRGGGGWTYSVGARSLILVDGLSALNPGTGDINWNTIPMEQVEQVEVMKGASSVLYGSSALNGVINVLTARPGLTPKTNIRAYVGIYGDAKDESYQWSDKGFWEEGKYGVTPVLRSSVLSGIRQPIYEGADATHSRRIGNFDVTGGVNLFTDEGYRQDGYNKRFRIGGNLTYHQPDMGEKIVNYGFNVNMLSNKYGDFFLWRSPKEVYQPSPLSNMGREGNIFYIDPFFNFTNTEKNTSHKIKGRVYYRGNNIMKPSDGKSAIEILGNMGTDANALMGLVNDFQNGNLSSLDALWQPILQGDLDGGINAGIGILDKIFPTATAADYMDLLGWMMNNGLPSLSSISSGGIPSDLIPWLSNAMYSQGDEVLIDKNYTYYLNYQFNKKFDGGAQITAGTTYERMRSNSKTTGLHNSDNAAVFFQYDHRFWDRLGVSAGVRAEYYRVDEHYREAETKLFGTSIPVKPIFRMGLNYQLADYSYLRASFGQGYRYPSLTEKYAHRDIGGIGVYPNNEVKAEKGINAELGFKQGYKLGPVQGMFDIAGFYTQYTDMIEFRFGVFDNTTFEYISSTPDLIRMLMAGNMPGFGAQFYNVSKARIYGTEISTFGNVLLNKDMDLTFNVGYIYLEPRDVDYKKINELEATYTDPLQMKEKSNNSKYLKYRQKHSAKASLDYRWKRLSLGTNLNWKSKILAVDYLMVDERPESRGSLMDYLRSMLYGYADGENLTDYWIRTNKGHFTMDLRTGVSVTKEVQFRFIINNLLNTEYSYRPMAVAAPRTYVMQINIEF